MIKISVLEVNIFAIKNNLSEIKRLLNYNQKLCMVAKANCYGLGSRKLCKELNDFVDYYAVSSAKEFFEIRGFVSKPIVILDPIYSDIKRIVRAGAELTISNLESLQKIVDIAEEINYKIKIHLAINTGMNRFGFKTKKEISDAVNYIKKTQNIVISGVFSHYFDAKSEENANFQFRRFMEIKQYLLKEFGLNTIYHLASSDGILYRNGFDMVRTGMILYSDKKYQTITLKSRVIDIQSLNKNETAGYGAIFKADKFSKIAVVGIGYGDGIFRNIVNKGYVLINNKYAKIVAVCMDTILVDITNIETHIYDEVIIIGKSKDKQIFICDVASWCDTIDYEIIVRLSDRVERKYIY